jgi:hypothetical protein
MGRFVVGAVVIVSLGLGSMGCGGEEYPSGTGGGFGGGGGGGGFGGGGGGTGTSCGPQNCTGCCFNGSCQPGSTAAGCGKGGGSCAACATNQVCRVDQTCGVDPESSWRVQPVSAQIAPNNNGSSWDGDGSGPDPQVYMTCGASTSGSTPEAGNTYQPRWSSGGCVTKAKDLLASGWTFQLYDIDLTSDDTITAALKVTIGEGDFIAGGFNVGASGGLQSMAVQLIKQ